MRYVAHALNGHGYAYNVGEQSFGITSPAWAALMTLVTSIAGNEPFVWKFTSALCYATSGILLLKIFLSFSSNLVYSIALVHMVLLEPHLFRWSSSGMENGFAALYFCLLLTCFIQSRSNGSVTLLAALAACAPYIRPEFGLYSVAIGCFVMFAGYCKRALLKFTLVGFLTSLIAVILVHHQFGGIVPQTAAAKAIFLKQANSFYGLTQSIKICLSGAAAAVLLIAYNSKNEKLHPWTWISLLATVVTIAYLATANQLVSTRYSIYLAFPLIIAAALELSKRSCPHLSKANKGLALLQICLSLGLLMFTFPATRSQGYRQIQNIRSFFSQHTTRESRIATTEVGLVGYASGRYIIDLVGLTDWQTLEWGKQNGRPVDTAQLEKLLRFRKATHYLDGFAHSRPNIVGETIEFVPLQETQSHLDSNFSAGAVTPQKWKLYRLKFKNEK
jgi:hypothetical protein